MNWAQNSDSKTHAEKSNPTSRTDFSSKALWDIFFGSPCISYKYQTNTKDIAGQSATPKPDQITQRGSL